MSDSGFSVSQLGASFEFAYLQAKMAHLRPTQFTMAQIGFILAQLSALWTPLILQNVGSPDDKSANSDHLG
jgi:hypothetical protein